MNTPALQALAGSRQDTEFRISAGHTDHTRQEPVVLGMIFPTQLFRPPIIHCSVTKRTSIIHLKNVALYVSVSLLPHFAFFVLCIASVCSIACVVYKLFAPLIHATFVFLRLCTRHYFGNCNMLLPCYPFCYLYCVTTLYCFVPLFFCLICVITFLAPFPNVPTGGHL